MDTIRDELEKRWAQSITEDRGGIDLTEASLSDWLTELRPELRLRALEAMRSWMDSADEWRELLAVRLARRFGYQRLLSDAVRLATKQGAERDARKNRLLVEIVDAIGRRELYDADWLLDEIINSVPTSTSEIVLWSRAQLTRCLLWGDQIGPCLAETLAAVRIANDRKALITVLAWLSTIGQDLEVDAALSESERKEIRKRVPRNPSLRA